MGEKYRFPHKNIVNETKSISNRVSKLERNPQLPHSSVDTNELTIDGGDLKVKAGSFVLIDASGRELVRLGDLSSFTTRGFLFFRENNGAPAFYLGGNASGNQYWALVDNNGNILASDDSATKQGLARPYLPFTATPAARLTSMESTTTSGTFTTMYRIHGLKQHPRIQSDFVIQTPVGVTAEVRYFNNLDGTPILLPGTNLPLTIPASSAGYFTYGPTSIGGGHMGGINLDVQMRVASGAGTVGMTHVDTYGLQS